MLGVIETSQSDAAPNPVETSNPTRIIDRERGAGHLVISRNVRLRSGRACGLAVAHRRACKNNRRILTAIKAMNPVPQIFVRRRLIANG
jgi:hypothetical protein